MLKEERDKKLSKLGDSLEKLSKINWEIFRSTIENALDLKERTCQKEVALRMRSILLFKILILQRLYNLSDDQTELQN